MKSVNVKLPEKVWLVLSSGRLKSYHTKGGAASKFAHTWSGGRVFEFDLVRGGGWVEVTEEFKK